MSHVSPIPEDEAEGLLEQLYAGGRARAGGVANIIRIMSHDPSSADASMKFYIALMKRSNALGAARREMLATVVSNVNACYY